MTNLSKSIEPKSDQLNADDLIGKTLTIKVSRVTGTEGDAQPISIHFDGDNGKPYKPCKSMRRVLVICWGDEGKEYAGRSMTLYRDEKVMFGGIAVGGIRISHMSHIEKETTMALTASRASRKPYTVKPLTAQAAAKAAAPPSDLSAEAKAFADEIKMVDSAEKLAALESRYADICAKLAHLPKWKSALITLWDATNKKFPAAAGAEDGDDTPSNPFSAG